MALDAKNEELQRLANRCCDANCRTVLLGFRTYCFGMCQLAPAAENCPLIAVDAFLVNCLLIALDAFLVILQAAASAQRRG